MYAVYITHPVPIADHTHAAKPLSLSREKCDRSKKTFSIKIFRNIDAWNWTFSFQLPAHLTAHHSGSPFRRSSSATRQARYDIFPFSSNAAAAAADATRFLSWGKNCFNNLARNFSAYNKLAPVTPSEQWNPLTESSITPAAWSGVIPPLSATKRKLTSYCCIAIIHTALTYNCRSHACELSMRKRSPPSS